MIKTAVITGHHEYDVVGLHQFLRTLEGIDAYPQNLEDFATDMGSPLSFYDVVVFYNYHLSTPGSTGSDLDHAIQQVLHELILGQTGILLLHHAIVGYQQWDMWDALAGMSNRITTGADIDQHFQIDISNPPHPISYGLSPYQMVDETYVMGNAGDDNEILLTTDFPNSMKTIVWTNQRASGGRVFCFQSGHDAVAFSVPSFQTVLHRGIQWLARKL